MIIVKIDSKNLSDVLDKINGLNLDIVDSYLEKDMVALNEVFRKSLKRIDQEFFDRYIKNDLIDELPYSEYRLWMQISGLKELREEYSLEIMDNILRREIFNMLSIEDLDVFAGFDILNILNSLEIVNSFPLESKDRFKIMNKARVFLMDNYDGSLWRMEELETHIKAVYLSRKDEIIKEAKNKKEGKKFFGKQEDVNPIESVPKSDIPDIEVPEMPEIPEIPEMEIPDIDDPTDIVESKSNSKKRHNNDKTFLGRGKPKL